MKSNVYAPPPSYYLEFVALYIPATCRSHADTQTSPVYTQTHSDVDCSHANTQMSPAVFAIYKWFVEPHLPCPPTCLQHSSTVTHQFRQLSNSTVSPSIFYCYTTSGLVGLPTRKRRKRLTRIPSGNIENKLQTASRTKHFQIIFIPM